MEFSIFLLVMVIWLAVSSSRKIKNLQLHEKELEWRIETLERFQQDTARSSSLT